MDASTIINDSMSLEEKLKAIDEAVKEQQNTIRRRDGLLFDSPIDPALLTICDGCE